MIATCLKGIGNKEYIPILENKVANILKIKKSSHNTNTHALESEIDRLVYELYGLTEEEIEIVENG